VGQTYKGFSGLLYPGGNLPPLNHRDAGLQFARSVVPLDRLGQPSDAGAIVLMSIGMSNTTQEWCSAATNADGGPPCDAWTFTGQALADPQVDRRWLRIVDGARGSQTASAWDMPGDSNYNRVRDERLAPLGLTEAQVQVVWIKLAIPQPTVALPAMTSDARTLQTQLGGVLRSVRVRYPNLKLALLSSRVYAGFATTTLNPEPYAYETGFAVKWTIEAQVTQAASGTVDSYTGSLAYPAQAPWAGWGPYLWADGLRPRADGLFWTRADFEADGTHPSTAGEQKVGAQLLSFFKNSPLTRCWFLNTMATCP
jgi:hypothetical protein